MTTQQQALEYFRSDDLIALGMGADQLRKQLHPNGLVSYSMEPADETVMTLAFAPEEPVDQIMAVLEAVRKLQAETGRLSAVMPRSEGTGMEQLKLLALARIFLDNVPHIQASWQGGLKVAQVALHFGANDINGAEAGSLRATEEDFRRIIHDAGFVPKQRDRLFRTYYLV